MASFLNKIRMKSAKNKLDRKDFTHQHLTTQNFCQIMPITNTELVPDSKVSCSPQSFCRFEPMPQPTFMKVNIINRAFFVPYNVVWRPFNAFITKTRYVSSSGVSFVSEVPKVSMFVLNKYFFDRMHVSNEDMSIIPDDEVINSDTPLGQFVRSTSNNPDAAICDLFWINAGAPVEPLHSGNYCARLSSKGRFIMKVLESLGYKLDTSCLAFDASAASKNFCFSVLPLLSYAKIFLDWYYPTQYSNGTNVFNAVDQILKREESYNVDEEDLDAIFELITSYFSEDNYFVNAFDHTFTPDSGSDNSVYLVQDMQPDTIVGSENNIVQSVGDSAPPQLRAGYTDSEGHIVPPQTQSQMSLKSVNSWAIAAVGRLGAWMHRNQLSGAKVIDRFLARYGVQLPEEKLGRCYYLGEQKFNAMFSDVMSTAETSDGSLGDYAGKGVAFDDSKTFEFQSNEFGQFIITNVVYPHVSYCQGFDRQLLHKDALDFYQPEFDGLGMQSIYRGELLTARSCTDWGVDNVKDITHVNNEVVDINSYSDYAQKVFGFQPRYAEMKCPRDRQTGNFSNPTTNRALPAWTPNRYFQMYKFGNEVIGSPGSIELLEDYIPTLVHSVDFMKDDGIQYLRLFYSNRNFMDCINFIHTFRMYVTAPILPLYDSFEFDDERHKQDVTINAQGSKLS